MLGGILFLFLGVLSSQEPKLILSATPRVALHDVATGGATFKFRASIVGELTERWYCPEVEWTWSDTTRRVEQEDCAPWEAGEEGPTSWTQRKLLGEGSHEITVRLLHNGEVVAKASVVVEVK